VTGTGDVLKNIQNITGTKGDDVLVGNELDNNLSGFDGNDIIDGRGQTGQPGMGDFLDGGTGIDTVTYASSTSAVSIKINGATGGSFGGDSKADDYHDSVFNFENIVGSNFNDVLISIAASQVNNIKGGGGNDLIEGGQGGDMLFGEAGIDTLSYATD